ncbi:MAG TPA: transposase [Gammaproteobacteria bacterium]|nr:transposase [Gammaproteobacteria bacterium]
MLAIEFYSTITCPYCGFQKTEVMPENSCQFFYECLSCKFFHS